MHQWLKKHQLYFTVINCSWFLSVVVRLTLRWYLGQPEAFTGNETQHSSAAWSENMPLIRVIQIPRISACDSSRRGSRRRCQRRQHDPSSRHWRWDLGSGGHAGLNGRLRVWKRLLLLPPVWNSSLSAGSHGERFRYFSLQAPEETPPGPWPLVLQPPGQHDHLFFLQERGEPEIRCSSPHVDGTFLPHFASSPRPMSTSCSGISSSVASLELPWSTTGWWSSSTSSSPRRRPSCLG